MNYLIHFFLVHFLADYPFQPGALVKLKKERYLGVLIHTLIHVLILLVVFFPLLHFKEIWIAIILVFVTHNIIDQTKITLNKKYPNQTLSLYITDQVIHLAILTGIAYYVGNPTTNLTGKWLELYTNQCLLSYLLVLVLVTYFYDVSRYFVLKKPTPYKRDYRTMMINAMIVSVAYGLYWIFY